MGVLQRKYFKRADLNLCQSADALADDREKAIQQTRVVFAHFLRFLLGTAASIPAEILEVGQSVTRIVDDKFGREGGDAFLCGYFFLRFLCPSLASPSSAIHCNIPSNIQKYCILLSRILQASVNNQEFESENMHFANEIIHESQHQIGELFACLRSGTFEGNEAIASATVDIQREMKKYRHKCSKGDCGAEATVSKEESYRYFADFLKTNGFAIRKKIKSKSEQVREEKTPFLVTKALANLKLLQNLLQSSESELSLTCSPSSSSSSSTPSPHDTQLHFAFPFETERKISLTKSPPRNRSNPLLFPKALTQPQSREGMSETLSSDSSTHSTPNNQAISKISISRGKPLKRADNSLNVEVFENFSGW